jgi:nucleotide-binding universal stress UspA family protein
MTTPGSRPVDVACEGPPGGAGALEYAVDEALRDGNRLHLVHVWPGSPPQDLVPVVACGELQAAGRAVLDESSASARRMAPGLEITTDLVVGPRSGGILRASRSGRLLVVGRSARHRFDLPFGSTPAAVAARAACPVVVVPSSWGAVSTARRVVVGMKSRRHALELLSHAFHIAQERGAEILVITSWELYDPSMDRREVAQRAAEWEAEGTAVLESLVEEWRARFPGVPVELRVAHGRPAHVLEVASAGADLLLVGRHQRAVPPYGRLGATAHTVLRTSRCPVEVVPAGVVAVAPAPATSASRAS